MKPLDTQHLRPEGRLGIRALVGAALLTVVASAAACGDDGGGGGSAAGSGGSAGQSGAPGGGPGGVPGAGSGGSAQSGSANAGQSGGGSANTAGAPGTCASAVTGTCAAPTVRITEVAIPTAVVPNGNEFDTLPLPLAIAALPSGGSRVAWLGDDDRVHVAELDCSDQLVGTPFSFPAHDFQDIALDANGGVLVVSRDAEGGGTLNCGNEAALCRAPDDPIACFDLYLVRFDNAGNEQWAAKLTGSSASAPPYSAGDGANHFIWAAYQHHTRLAYDGTNYAAYFCDAITIQNGACVDIHEGDRMQVVGPSGSVLTGHDSFEGGCSHSWNTRIVWDQRTGHFVMVCATDNANRVARPAPYRTIFEAPDIGTLSVGDLVLSTGPGYWLTASHQGTIHLLHFVEAEADRDIEVGSSPFSHLAAYGANRLLVAWESGSGMTAHVRDAGDGSVVSQPFGIAVPDHRYQSFKSFPDGSVAYPAQGTNNRSIRIARVLPCSG